MSHRTRLFNPSSVAISILFLFPALTLGSKSPRTYGWEREEEREVVAPKSKIGDTVSGSAVTVALYSVSKTNGNWSIPQTILEDKNLLDMDLAVDSKGNWHLVYTTVSYFWSGEIEYEITVVKYLNSKSSTSEAIDKATYIYDKSTHSVSGSCIRGPRISIDSDGKIHVVYRYGFGSGDTWSEVIKYTTKQFPKLMTVIPGINDHGEKMVKGAKSMFGDDDECIIDICESSDPNMCREGSTNCLKNPSPEEVGQKVKEITKKAKEKGRDIIVNIDMDLENYWWEYFIPIFNRWQRSVEWAGRIANIVSESFTENNPIGDRILYAHSAGADAAYRSIEQKSGERMYDNLNLLNGRTPAYSLKTSLIQNGYQWWQVKVFTNKRDLPASRRSISNYIAAKQFAGTAWVHLHCDDERLNFSNGHGWLRDNISTTTEFEVNLGELGSSREIGTVADMILKH